MLGLLPADLRRLARDELLVWMPAVPLAMALAARLGVPALLRAVGPGGAGRGRRAPPQRRLRPRSTTMAPSSDSGGAWAPQSGTKGSASGANQLSKCSGESAGGIIMV